MKLVYSRQALADLDAIATYYASTASPPSPKRSGSD
jgi:plasmid stabilization system protein ParE